MALISILLTSEIDQHRINLIQEIMSRPFHPLFALSLAAFSLGLFGCETIYRPIYSNRVLHYKPPGQLAKEDGTKQKTAEEILKEQDAAAQGATTPSANPLDSGAMPPAVTPAPDAAMPGMATPPPAATPPPPN
jgi:hypothetical protein